MELADIMNLMDLIIIVHGNLIKKWETFYTIQQILIHISFISTCDQTKIITCLQMTLNVRKLYRLYNSGNQVIHHYNWMLIRIK